MNFSPYLRYIAKTKHFIHETVVARDCRLIYVLSGRGTFESGEMIFDLSPNTLIYYPYATPYRIRNSHSEEMLFFTVNFDFTREFTHLKTMTPKPVHRQKDPMLETIPREVGSVFSGIIHFPNAFWAENLLHSIYTETLKQSCEYEIVCDLYLKILLMQIFRHTLKESPDNPLCERIKEHIHQNPRTNIDELAAKLNYHPYYLNAVFKKSEGDTLHRFLIRQRLIRAKELIGTTQLPLEEIANMCGFASQSHFTSAFKAAYGVTPGLLRRQI